MRLSNILNLYLRSQQYQQSPNMVILGLVFLAVFFGLGIGGVAAVQKLGGGEEKSKLLIDAINESANAA